MENAVFVTRTMYLKINCEINNIINHQLLTVACSKLVIFRVQTFFGIKDINEILLISHIT